MAAEFKGGEQRPRCEQEEGRKRGRRLFEAVDDSAQDEKALRKLLAHGKLVEGSRLGEMAGK